MKQAKRTVPEFPVFKSIDILDKPIIDRFTSSFDPYVDFMYSNLVSWNKRGLSSEYSFLKGNLVLKTQEYTKNNSSLKCVYSLLGDSDIDPTINLLLDKYNSLGLIPEHVFKQISPSDKLVFEADRGNFEYIYDLRNISSLKGNSLEHRRRAYKRFKLAHPTLSFETLDLSNPDTHHKVKQLNLSWLHQSRVGVDENIEVRAFNKYMRNISDFDYYAFGLYIDGSLIAYVIVEPFNSNSEYVIATFAKSDKWSYPGASIYIMVELSKYLLDMGYSYLNYDVDLGLKNLRMYKSLWRPVRYLKKYRLYRK